MIQIKMADHLECLKLFLVSVRGSEVFQNVPGLASKLHFKMTMMSVDETSDLMTKVNYILAVGLFLTFGHFKNLQFIWDV